MTRHSRRGTLTGSIVLTPHRENAPRTQCPSCKGGGEINDIRCRDCSGRGYHDAQHPPRTTETTTDAY